MSIRVRLVFAFFMFVFVGVAVGQVSGLVEDTEKSSSVSDDDKSPPVNIHGTVNIILANQNGIVAVTDSRLSSEDRKVGVGQKLFKIDDHTICTMAGSYQLPGPTKDTVHYPAGMVISNLISQFSIRNNKSTDNPELKLARLAALVELHLSLLDAMNESQGIATGKYLTVLTFAAYYEGRFQLWQTTVQPIHGSARGSLRYLHTLPEQAVITDSLMYVLAGWTDVAKTELDRTESKISDPAILRYFHRQVIVNRGNKLSRQSLFELAKLLEQRTADRYKNVVGDDVQAAQITKVGIVESLQPSRFPLPAPSPFKQVTWLEYIQILLSEEEMQALRDKGSYGTLPSGLQAIPKVLAVVVMGGKISGLEQAIDGFYFHQTRFERCQLTYNGSPIFLFDQSNSVIDSVLKLGPGVLRTDPHVQQLLKNFPQLKLLDTNSTP